MCVCVCAHMRVRVHVCRCLMDLSSVVDPANVPIMHFGIMLMMSLWK